MCPADTCQSARQQPAGDLLALPAQHAEQGLRNGTVSVRLRVCLSQHGHNSSSKHDAAGLLL